MPSAQPFSEARDVVRRLDAVLTKYLSGQVSPREVLDVGVQVCERLRASSLDEFGKYHLAQIERYMAQLCESVAPTDFENDAIASWTPEIGLLKSVWNLDAHVLGFADSGEARKTVPTQAPA